MRVFISHADSPSDVVAAKAITRQFDMLGHQVRRSLDFYDDPLGMHREIAIQNSDLFVIILTSDYRAGQDDHPDLKVAREYNLQRYFLVAESIFDVPVDVREGQGHVTHLARNEKGYKDAVVNVLDYFEDTESARTKQVPTQARVQTPAQIYIAYAPRGRILAAQMDRILRNEHERTVYWQTRTDDAKLARAFAQQALHDAQVVLVIWSDDAEDSIDIDRQVNEAIRQRKTIVLMLQPGVEPPRHLQDFTTIMVLDDLLQTAQQFVDAL
jgi:catechol 2,3-dioxygenase-like lactoylglutathione lyase family enzyme